MKLFVIGGFLGSGKTTAIRQASLDLMAYGVTVGVVTNDQGVQLVDSGWLKASGIPTREVPNGCFCCHYDQLENSIRSLLEECQPEVIFAESVGSCTDLVATVVKPWLKFHPETAVVVSVFADARLLLKEALNAHLFVQSVTYLYDKQLEEADVLVVNKIDLLTTQQLAQVEQFVRKRLPGKQVCYQNSLEKDSIGRWLGILHNFQIEAPRSSLTIDYDTYAAGEAQLGWLDAEMEIHTVDGNAWEAGVALIHYFHSTIQQQQLAIGHLKFLLDNGRYQRKLSFTSIAHPNLATTENEAKTNRICLLINARVEADPTLLREILLETVSQVEARKGCRVTMGKMAAFQPGYPRPTHRMPD